VLERHHHGYDIDRSRAASFAARMQSTTHVNTLWRSSCDFVVVQYWLDIVCGRLNETAFSVGLRNRKLVVADKASTL